MAKFRAGINEKCRCNVCDKVGSSEIADEIEDIHYRGFVKDPDPSKDGFICSDCAGWVADLRHDYNLMDEED